MRRAKEYQFYPGTTRCIAEPSGNANKQRTTALVCLAAEGLGALLTNTEVPKMRRVKEYPPHPETTSCIVCAEPRSIHFTRAPPAVLVSPRAASTRRGILHFHVWLQKDWVPCRPTLRPQQRCAHPRSIHLTRTPGALLVSPRGAVRSIGLLHFYEWLQRGFGALLTNTEVAKVAASRSCKRHLKRLHIATLRRAKEYSILAGRDQQYR
ncbi:uncharacterized protein [Dermacentor albipictus]|uniref:uncharacterized protein isoform X2 n=1 Tax=Dermacentor albipictus TaxID=60249 RepID=UPI0038FCF901